MLRAALKSCLLLFWWVCGRDWLIEGKERPTAPRSGRCGGNNFLRLGGTGRFIRSYTLRNFDATQLSRSIKRFFDANGNVLFDTAGGRSTRAENASLGRDNTLNPNQTGALQHNDILPFLADRSPDQSRSNGRRPGTPRPRCHYDKGCAQRNPRPARFAERGRHATECRSSVR